MVILIGRLGKDPELRYTPQGSPVCNFSLATGETYKLKDGTEKNNTQWHQIVVWGSQAESCAQYLGKGSQTFIEGELNYEKFTDKQGVERVVAKVKASRVLFLNKEKSFSEKPEEQFPMI